MEEEGRVLIAELQDEYARINVEIIVLLENQKLDFGMGGGPHL